MKARDYVEFGSSLSRWERGRVRAGLRRVRACCRALTRNRWNRFRPLPVGEVGVDALGEGLDVERMVVIGAEGGEGGLVF